MLCTTATNTSNTIRTQTGAADTTTTESTTSTAEIALRQPPTVAEVTAAASRSPTLMYHHRVSPCRQHCLHNAL